MKLEKISVDGKINSLEVNDSIFTSKINKKLISEILYKNIANFKGRVIKISNLEPIKWCSLADPTAR